MQAEAAQKSSKKLSANVATSDALLSVFPQRSEARYLLPEPSLLLLSCEKGLCEFIQPLKRHISHLSCAGRRHCEAFFPPSREYVHEPEKGVAVAHVHRSLLQPGCSVSPIPGRRPTCRFPTGGRCVLLLLGLLFLTGLEPRIPPPFLYLVRQVPGQVRDHDALKLWVAEPRVPNSIVPHQRHDVQAVRCIPD